MSVGQAYFDVLTSNEQRALQTACDVLIDGCFDGLKMVDDTKDIVHTSFATHLPERYLYRYTPSFLRRFTVCIITVAWKLAQSEVVRLSSLAEELAVWVIINEAKVVLELEEEKEEEDAFDAFIDALFEDTDLAFLFDNAYDGIDETQLADMMGISSLAFNDWFLPFSDEPSRIVHPYVI